MISVSKEYDIDIKTLFYAAGHFELRSRWQEGVKAVEEVNHFLPRVGMRHKCILENGQFVIFTSSYSFNPERIEFSETDEDKKNSTYYLLETTGNNNKTKLTLDFYIRKNIANQILFKLIKKKLLITKTD